MKRSYKLYAAFGSNMDVYKRFRICPFAKLLGVGVLEDYKLTFRGKNKGVINIEPCSGGTLPVVLWYITKHCERAMDLAGKISGRYVKEQVQVKFRRETLEALVYVMPEERRSQPAQPTPFYIETLVHAYNSNGLIKDILYDAVQDTQRELSIKKYESLGDSTSCHPFL
ncbi:gamma-glutamylcyclotransferase [Aminipila butyrica]|uniref:Gamma-glutamylcyclotransferase n=1 Tax=Aminipila butyrica TaxID=433296 RepID=A0A858BW84_9FIRM|nr:gamma-glutamylcyclotransferase family protein [Aminipila butyrica]QIB70341.1 gamma-glutamylcyclotransferase [Aminipila butyrica]